MKLKVTNLGVLGSAEIDLSKRINLFFGENGTGKTYLAYLIYALASNQDRVPVFRNSLKMRREANRFTFPTSKSAIATVRDDLIKNVLSKLFVLFSLPQEQAKERFMETSMEILDSESSLSVSSASLARDGENPDFKWRFIQYPNSDELILDITPLSSRVTEFTVGVIGVSFAEQVLTSSAIYPIRSSTIFPVERNSVYTFIRELSIHRNELLDEIQLLNATNPNSNGASQLSSKSTRYPLAIRDALRVAQDLDNISKSRSFLYDLATTMETELLGGVVSTTTEGQVEFASQRAPKLYLSFHQSSSIVKTLASLIFYMKHRATPEDLVIIDEPELNLHPKAQIILTRYLARMAKAGLRLLISTHSDYIVREFNNLIMLHGQKDDPELRKLGLENGYAEADVDGVDPETVGAHHFSFASPKAKKAHAKQIKVDEFGFGVSSFDETITQLNEISDKLYYSKKYGEVIS